MTTKISIKRVYEEPGPTDGLRILVDRLWPRGLSKDKAKIDVWFKSVAPSDELRKWYQHDIRKWQEFRKRYFAELGADTDSVSELENYVKKGNVTFLFATKESEHNNAVALKEYISRVLS